MVYHILHQTRVDNSIVQQYVFDVMRDCMLSVRCWLGDRNGMLFVIIKYKVLYFIIIYVDFMSCWRLLIDS